MLAHSYFARLTNCSYQSAKMLFSTTPKVSHLRTPEATALPDFGDHKLIFSHHVLTDLCRNLSVLQACAVGPLVTHADKLLHLGRRVLGERYLMALVSPFYGQFVAGNTEHELRSVATTLTERNIGLMLAPMLEGDVSDRTTAAEAAKIYSKNFTKMVWFIILASRHGKQLPGVPALCQAKVTGHCAATVLEKVSEQYTTMRLAERRCAVQWVTELMIALTDSCHLHHILLAAEQTGNVGYERLHENCKALLLENRNFFSSGLLSPIIEKNPFTLSPDSVLQFVHGIGRVACFGVLAQKLGVALAVDAEFTYVNPAINLITLALMNQHCQNTPSISNTYQAYLKSTKAWLDADRQLAESLGCCFSLKLVRGAYMLHEARVSHARNAPNPLQDSYEDTNHNYNSIAQSELAWARACPERSFFLLATHNEESVRRALVADEDLFYQPHSGRVCAAFGQIYGMAENITVPLAAAGATVYKSVPLGSLTEVLPYLARRASENRSVLQGARRERALLLKEITSRAKAKLRLAGGSH